MSEETPLPSPDAATDRRPRREEPSAAEPPPRPPQPRAESAEPPPAADHAWRSVGIFLLILLGLLLAMRMLHLGIPIFYPKVLDGPFSLDALAEVEEYTGFQPLVPFYRPEVLGTGPVNITARRSPRPQVTVFWQGRRFLRLTERQGGSRPFVRPGARPLPNHPESLHWQEGRTRRVVIEDDGLWVEIRTDLPEEDLHRLVETLRPYEELL